MYVNGVDMTSQVPYGWSNRGTYVTGNIQSGTAPFGIGAGYGRVVAHGTNVSPSDSTWDSVRIYPRELSVAEIQDHLANGIRPSANPMNKWCFLDPSDFGHDSAAQANNLRISGGMVVEGRSITCDGGLPAPGYRLSGSNTSQFVSRSDFRLPPTPFTVEGWVRIGNSGSMSQQYLLSYATSTTTDCLSVRANIGTYDVWVHWAMTVDTNNQVQHYLNATAASGGAMMGSSRFCGDTNGSLVLGQRQTSIGGGFNSLHSPNVVFDSLRIHPQILSITQLNQTFHGGDGTSAPLWSAYCFTDETDFGYDSSGRNQSLTVVGGAQADGFTAGCAGINSWTSCQNVVYVEMARWIPVVSGVMSVPPLVHECSPYEYRAVPQHLRAPAGMHSLRFVGPGLKDVEIVNQYANFVSPVQALSLDLSGNAITRLGVNAFGAFGSRITALDVSNGALTLVDGAALHGLSSMTVLNLGTNRGLQALPDFWLANLSSLAVVQLDSCG